VVFVGVPYLAGVIGVAAAAVNQTNPLSLRRRSSSSKIFEGDMLLVGFGACKDAEKTKTRTISCVNFLRVEKGEGNEN
jgi:hypothetical protein